MKAYLTSQDMAFEKIHDLGRLVAQAATRETRFDRWTTAAQLLTPYATAFRYPGIGEDPMPTREEFEEAARYAQAIYEFVIELVPGGHPQP